MYQSHKGWTSNLLNIKLNLNYKEYQSHKGWTSNNINDLSWDELTNRINPTRGGRQTQYRHSPRSRPGSINPTRGGRQTSMWIYSSVAGAVYQSHKGWTSNPSTFPVFDDMSGYQSHKGWTSNRNRFPAKGKVQDVSIPQGVDVKR